MKNKKNFRRISIVTSGLDDKHIKSLSDLIKTNENDNIFIHNLFNRDETFTLLKQALSKYMWIDRAAYKSLKPAVPEV